MKKAAELLTSTRLSVAEIAELVGYMNQSKFASVFKKQFGLSPLEYRRSKNWKIYKIKPGLLAGLQNPGFIYAQNQI